MERVQEEEGSEGELQQELSEGDEQEEEGEIEQEEEGEIEQEEGEIEQQESQQVDEGEYEGFSVEDARVDVQRDVGSEVDDEYQSDFNASEAKGSRSGECKFGFGNVEIDGQSEKGSVGFRHFDDSHGGMFAQNIESSGNIPADNTYDMRTSQSITLSETKTAKAYITNIISFKRQKLFESPPNPEPKITPQFDPEPIQNPRNQAPKPATPKLKSPINRPKINSQPDPQPTLAINIQSINPVSIPPPKNSLNLSKAKHIKRYTNRTLNLQATACERLSKITPPNPTPKPSGSPASKAAQQFPPIKPFSPQETIRHVRKIYSR